MAWLISKALMQDYESSHCSQGQAAEYLAATCSDGGQSALSSGNPTPQAYCASDKMTAFSRLSRFGMTFAPLTADRGEAVLTWYLAGFHAKPTAAHLEDDLWLTISGRRCGGSWQMSLPGTYLPRTSREEQSIERRTNSRRWGTRRSAPRYPRKTWVATTYGNAIGYLHTPTTTANYDSPSMQKWPNCRSFVTVFGKPMPDSHEYLMGWPQEWTGLQQLETAKFRLWQQRHFECCGNALDCNESA